MTRPRRQHVHGDAEIAFRHRLGDHRARDAEEPCRTRRTPRHRALHEPSFPRLRDERVGKSRRSRRRRERPGRIFSMAKFCTVSRIQLLFFVELESIIRGSLPVLTLRFPPFEIGDRLVEKRTESRHEAEPLFVLVKLETPRRSTALVYAAATVSASIPVRKLAAPCAWRMRLRRKARNRRIISRKLRRDLVVGIDGLGHRLMTKRG